MLSIKDVHKKDQSLFFNTDELADKVMINGEEKTVILDNQRLKELQVKMGESIHRAEVLFSVKKLDLPAKPGIGKTIKFGKISYKIIDCLDEGLTYKVTLGANRS